MAVCVRGSGAVWCGAAERYGWVKEDMRKVNVLYVFGSGVVVLLVAVVANNPVVSRRAISQPPGAESLSCSSRSKTEAVLAPQSATRPIVSLFNLTPISHFTPCSLRTCWSRCQKILFNQY
jgi:hypothetical protein